MDYLLQAEPKAASSPQPCWGQDPCWGLRAPGQGEPTPLSCFLLLVPLSLFFSPTMSFMVTRMGTYPAGSSQARAGLGCCQSFSRIATQHPQWFTPLGDQPLGPHPAPTPAAAGGCFKHPWWCCPCQKLRAWGTESPGWLSGKPAPSLSLHSPSMK